MSKLAIANTDTVALNIKPRDAAQNPTMKIVSVKIKNLSTSVWKPDGYTSI